MNFSMDERKEACSTKKKTDKILDPSNPETKKKKPKRAWKKPKDKPKRPLSAYNMFFQNYRERIVSGKVGDATPEEITHSVEMVLQSKNRGPKRRQDRVSHNRISFGDLARTIADKWKILDPKSRSIYSHYAGKEKNRYRKEVLIWKQKKESEHDAELMARHANLLNSSTHTSVSRSSLHSSIGSDTTSSSSASNSLFDPSNSISSQLQLQLQQQEGCRDQNQNQIYPVVTTLESSMTQEGVIRRQQNILREQMGFKDNDSSQSWSNSSSFANAGGIGGGGNNNTTYPYPCVSPCGPRSMITPNDIMAVALQRQQYEQLEDITLQLHRLKQEQERMQQQIMDHPDMQTTGSRIAMNSTNTSSNVALDRSSHMNDLSVRYSNNNNQSISVDSLRCNFDSEERQRMEGAAGVGVSVGSSSGKIFPRGHSSCPGSFHAASGVAGQLLNRRHNFLFSIGDNVPISNVHGGGGVTGNNSNSNNNGHSSCPISFLASAATSFSRRNSLFDNVNGEPVDDDISPMMFSLDPK
ncbi:hypothetical protein FRACYDRAFT_239876 [Fragilariopsis cylindrus CCMP1102]|uniref:HMG box domain-containing protein n=1 Tax=Fragilariopsis cylindrus CCMP1102 TaxID=635003 RepID=A0A1E7FAJ7_9STRA|nr:hypothetical protein FRACYDRAFT_239876 [Fragilariopsis cylindrus CCMP1102]|eukprot:OEU15200.1 hypothetical protein FRACYDRAFT_239876 [Fragilariopsis cylindrus CCMP1102]